jgi:hypothetical protein
MFHLQSVLPFVHNLAQFQKKCSFEVAHKIIPAVDSTVYPKVCSFHLTVIVLAKSLECYCCRTVSDCCTGTYEIIFWQLLFDYLIIRLQVVSNTLVDGNKIVTRISFMWKEHLVELTQV